MQVAAGLTQGVPSDLRESGCSQQTQCYLQLRIRPVLWESDGPQTGSWSSPGSGCGENPRAAGETTLWEVLLVLGFDTENGQIIELLRLEKTFKITRSNH